MLTETGHSRLMAALHAWADHAPNEPVMGFVADGGFLMLHEIVDQIKLESQLGQAFLKILEHGIRREGIETVVSRFGAGSRGMLLAY